MSLRAVSPAGLVSTLRTSILVGNQYYSAGGALAVAPGGSILLADTSRFCIRQYDPASDNLSVLAGGCGVSGYADGDGTAALFLSPSSISVDAAGTAYVSDGPFIRKVSAGGQVSTLAGSPVSTTNDGPGHLAGLGAQQALAVDADTGTVFACSASGQMPQGTSSIRLIQVTPDGFVTTVAAGVSSGTRDGVGAAASVGNCNSMVVVGGDLFFGDIQSVRRVLLNSTLTLARKPACVAASTTFVYWSANNTWACICSPGWIGSVCQIPPRIVTTLAGMAGSSGEVMQDGQGTAAQLLTVLDVVMAADRRSLLVATSYAVRRISLGGNVTTLAGGGNECGNYWARAGFRNGAGTAACFGYIAGMAVSADGSELFLADINNQAVRRVSLADNSVSNVAGRFTSADGVNFVGTSGFQDSPDAAFSGPSGIAFDARTGDLLVADAANYAIRRVTAAGVVSTLAGNGTSGMANGVGAAALWGYLGRVLMLANGDAAVADSNNCIRRVTPSGAVSTMAGLCGSSGGFADGTAARFSQPAGMALDPTAGIIITDSYNNRIRALSAAGVVRTIAGTGQPGYNNPSYMNGYAPAAYFSNPAGVAVGEDGTIYVADGTRTVRAIAPQAPYA
jgi:sugar lactone lactonase YvrE